MSLYREIIEEEARKLKVWVNPRHVEAWMRLQHGTLDHLPREEFRRYVIITYDMEAEDPGSGESLARSFGL